jgi:hypothetical protein
VSLIGCGCAEGLPSGIDISERDYMSRIEEVLIILVFNLMIL